MTDRSHRHAETVKTIRASLRAEIEWREQLIDQYLCSTDPTMKDVVEVYIHLKRKRNGDVRLDPGGDSWAAVRSRDILKSFDVWDEVHGEPHYTDATRVPLSEFAYMNEDGLDVAYVEGLVESSSTPDAEVSCVNGTAYIRDTADDVVFEGVIDFHDLEGTSAYNEIMRVTRELEMAIDVEQCDHTLKPDPGLDDTPSEGDLLVCDGCPYTERKGESMTHDPEEVYPRVIRRD